MGGLSQEAGIVLAGAVLSVEIAALIAYTPLVSAVAWLKYPQAECKLPEIIRSAAYHQERSNAHQQILRSARLIQRVGAYELWDIPGMRQFWIPGAFTRQTALVFSEQAARQYWHPSVHFQPGDVVLDVGADTGEVTFEALQAGAKKVVAVEIDPEKWPCLERTFADEISVGRVVLVRAGAWDSEGTLELGGDSVVLDRSKRKVKVRVTTIDQMIAELQLPRVDFIVMDIEGAEKPALRGAANTLRRFRPRMAIASEHLPDDVTAVPQTVRTIVPGYDVICGQCELDDSRLAARVLWFK